MTLRRRLSSLERRAAHLLAHGCSICGGLKSRSKSYLILRPDEELQTCSSCGLSLGRDGRPVGRANAEGRVALKVLVLDRDPSTVLGTG